MKKFFTTIMLALAAVTAYSADEVPVTHEHPQRIIVNKEECNDDDWYEWQTWTTGTITFEEGFYGGMGYTHPIDVEKRVSRDPENKTWQMRILNYHRKEPREGNIDELIIQYDPVAKKDFHSYPGFRHAYGCRRQRRCERNPGIHHWLHHILSRPDQRGGVF